jgi:hypothetical protein
LANRAKELQCFIDISKTAKRKDLSAEGYVHKINDLIPEYLSHASIICSRIVIGNRAIKSRKFKETDFIKKYKIFESDKIIGMLEIFFTEDFKKESCHFTEETDQVLKLIVDRISEIIEKKWIEKDLRKWEHFLKNASSNMDLYQ